MPMVSSLFVPGEVAVKRMEICKSCEHLTAIKLCKQCGCVMPLKVRIRPAACPISKWSEVDDDGQQHFVDDALWNEMEREAEKAEDRFKIKNPLDRR